MTIELPCDRGMEQIARLVCGATTAGSCFKYIGVGWGTEVEQPTNIALQHETTGGGLDRALATTWIDPGYGSLFWISKTFTVTAATAINEIGIFNSLTGGTMLSRQVMTYPLNAVPGDVLTFQYYGEFYGGGVS